MTDAVKLHNVITILQGIKAGRPEVQRLLIERAISHLGIVLDNLTREATERTRVMRAEQETL